MKGKHGSSSTSTSNNNNNNNNNNNKQEGLRDYFWRAVSFVSSLNRVVIQHEPFEHYFFRYYLLLNGFQAIRSSSGCVVPLTRPIGLGRYLDLTFMCTSMRRPHRKYLYLFFGFFFIVKKGPRVIWVLNVVFMTLFYLLFCTAKYSSGVLLHATNLQSLTMLAYMFGTLYYAARDFKIWWRNRYSRNVVTPTGGEAEGEEEDVKVAILQQVIGCGYFISAITKMINSHGNWIGNTGQILYIAKANLQEACSGPRRGASSVWGDLFVATSLHHTWIISVFFLGAYIIEVLSVLGFVWNRVFLFFGGVGLKGMHLGIKLMMQIDLPGFKPLVDGYFLNRPYWAFVVLRFCWETIQKLRNRQHLPSTEERPTEKENKWNWLLGKKRKHRAFSICPLWPALVTVVLCLYIGENYPFTPFGMYSAPSGNNYYFNLTDADGVMLSTSSVLGVSAGKFKKFRGDTLHRLKHFIEHAQGRDVGVRSHPYAYKWPLKLWRMDLHLRVHNGENIIMRNPPFLLEVANLTNHRPLEAETLYAEKWSAVPDWSRTKPRKSTPSSTKSSVNPEGGVTREEVLEPRGQ